jgi:NAD+ kinase
MQVGLVSNSEAGFIGDAKSVLKTLSDAGAEVQVEARLAQAMRRKGIALRKMSSDVVIVIGSDRLLLDTLLTLGDTQVPVLPVSAKGQQDFLFDVTSVNFKSIVKDLLEHRWSIESRNRLSVEIDGKGSPPLLNDLAIFARKSATLMRFSLYINDEHFLKDESDGVIIATPTGSTAYSMSVGGPIVLNPANVFTFVSVNSTNMSQRPIVLSDEMKVTIDDISCPITVEAVMDGQVRKKVNGGSVTVKRSESDAHLVKFTTERIAALRGKLLRRTKFPDDATMSLPPSAKLVLKVLEYHGYMSQKELIEETKLPGRTVRYALSQLISAGLIEKRVSLRDSRQGLFKVKEHSTSKGTSEDSK